MAATSGFVVMAAGKPLLVSASEWPARLFALKLWFGKGDIQPYMWSAAGKLLIRGEGYRYYWTGSEVLPVRCVDET